MTTNYYTGRTLEKGKTVLTPSVDNLIWIEEDEGILDKKLSFSLSFGIATGLPGVLKQEFVPIFPMYMK